MVGFKKHPKIILFLDFEGIPSFFFFKSALSHFNNKTQIIFASSQSDQLLKLV